MTVAAIATFRLSARPACGTVIHWSTATSRRVRRLVADDDQCRLGEVGLGVPAHRTSLVGCRQIARMRRGAERAKAARRGTQRAQHIVDRHVDNHRDFEQRAGTRANDLGVEHVDRATGQDDGIGSGRLGGAEHRARVARVVDPVGRRGRTSHRPARRATPLDGERRRAPVAASRSRRRAPSRWARARARRRRPDRPWGVDTTVPGGDEHRLQLPTGADRLIDQRWTLDHERTFVETRTAAPQEAPQSLNLWVRVRELVAQSAAFAAATS